MSQKTVPQPARVLFKNQFGQLTLIAQDLELESVRISCEKVNQNSTYNLSNTHLLNCIQQTQAIPKTFPNSSPK